MRLRPENRNPAVGHGGARKLDQLDGTIDNNNSPENSSSLADRQARRLGLPFPISLPTAYLVASIVFQSGATT